MYAIIRTGGKQYHVVAGDSLRVEKLAGNIGDSITIDDVLMVTDGDDIKVGCPVLEGAKVNAKIIEQDRAKKVLVFKKKKRKGYQVMKGHRQSFTRLEIQDIQA
ncbi:MAG: 50S ribosomal protein L21 [Deltaproteobacteria bacterium]|nr:50S ribosomal protein L21 [Deltaproteobacteria bacterium]